MKKQKALEPISDFLVGDYSFIKKIIDSRSRKSKHKIN